MGQMLKLPVVYWVSVAFASLWAPLLWMLVIVNGEGNRPTNLFFTEWHFFGSYLFNPMLFLWGRHNFLDACHYLSLEKSIWLGLAVKHSLRGFGVC